MILNKRTFFSALFCMALVTSAQCPKPTPEVIKQRQEELVAFLEKELADTYFIIAKSYADLPENRREYCEGARQQLCTASKYKEFKLMLRVFLNFIDGCDERETSAEIKSIIFRSDLFSKLLVGKFFDSMVHEIQQSGQLDRKTLKQKCTALLCANIRGLLNLFVYAKLAP